MDPVSLATAGLSAAGIAAGYFGQSQANATNVRLAREQMKFQERMSNTSMQRHRADLEAAGFNPMLGVGGPGASTPIGASARVENAPGAGITSGLGARTAMAQVELLKAQTDKARQEAFTEMMTRGGRVGELQSRIQLMDMDTLTKGKLLPLVAREAGARIEMDLASALQARTHSELLKAETIIKKFEQNHFRNMSAAEQSWWMRNINPYVSSAAEVVRTGTSVAMPLAIGRGARSIQRR